MVRKNRKKNRCLFGLAEDYVSINSIKQESGGGVLLISSYGIFFSSFICLSTLLEF